MADAAAQIGEIFRRHDTEATGKISRQRMKSVLQKLDPVSFEDSALDDLLTQCEGADGDDVKYEDFLTWIISTPTGAALSKLNISPAAWGEWMGAWKREAGEVNEEEERLSRQKAAFGADTGARLKDINVLILGCRGTGVEAAKNLILSNVGSVTMWDPTPATKEDLGANFYLCEDDVGKPRAAQCIDHLKSLNPYCKVEVLEAEEAALVGQIAEADVLSTGKGYAVVVVTDLLPRATLAALNTEARGKGIAFLMAVNTGVTTSVFSDFGPKHVISDENGEPTQLLAVSGAEFVPVGGVVKVDGVEDGQKVLVLALASEHALQDGDTVALDDMRGDLADYNGKQLKIKRFAIVSPTDAKVDINSVEVKERLKYTTGKVVDNFSKQYDFYKAKFDEEGGEGKLKTRDITLFNRLVVVLEEGQCVEQWESYRSGGLVNSVKLPVQKEYNDFEKTLVETNNPQMLDQEAWQGGEGCWVHIALATALKFQEEKGQWPGFLSDSDADEFVTMAKALSEERKATEGACWLQKVEWGFPSGEPLEDLAPVEAKLRRYSSLFQAELTGFCAYLGGMIAQEVIKKTGKFTPIEQWIHHDDGVLLVDGASSPTGSCEGTRYSYQAAVLGPEVMESVRSQNIFLVGCGALGCEYLKGLALMGACTAEGAKLLVTDMDRIEVSNLSRQFLFRQTDVGNPKSTSAARVVKGWNPDLQVEALEKGVGTTSEDFFDDAFWGSITLCWNALDNVKARKYTDSCCLWYGLPLLESGTLGTKSNSDVFLPGLTKSYNDSVETDSNENQIAMCTLRSFPYLPLHCIEFAKQSYFSDYMEFAPQQYESFRKDSSGFLEQLDAMSEAEQFKALKMIKEFMELQKGGAVDFPACVRKAFDQYCKDFITSIRDLVYNCDQVEASTGKPFWTGTKRRPTEAKWDPKMPPAEALEYLYAAANCFAFIWQVPYERNRGKFEELVVSLGLEVPEWTAPGGEAKVENEGEEEDDAEKVDPEVVMTLKGELCGVDTSGLQTCNVHDFEKDDDDNFHIDFLTIATNLRSANYDIKQSDRSYVKVTAGKIIPALATTTAMICGLVDVEFLKIAKGLHKGENALDQFYNANVNLAAGSQAINAFRPDPPVKKETQLSALPAYTTWDKVEIEGEISVKELVEQLEAKYSANIDRIFPAAHDQASVYDKINVAKQGWKIELGEDGVLVAEPDEVYSAWPQLRMAAQMLQKLPPGGARTNFENQVKSAQKSLAGVKETFAARFEGPVSKAYVEVSRPGDDAAEEQKYFDAVYEKRAHLALKVYLTNADGAEADIPVIKYTFKK